MNFMMGENKCKLAGTLPISLPITANLLRQRQSKRPVRQRPVVETAVILNPCRMVGILIEVLRRNRMMLTVHHATEPREERFRPVGAGVAGTVRFRMVDPMDLPTGV